MNRRLYGSLLWFGLTFSVFLLGKNQLFASEGENGWTMLDEWITLGLLVMTFGTLVVNLCRSLALFRPVEGARHIRLWQLPLALCNVGLFFWEIESINNKKLPEMETIYIVMNLLVWLFLAVVLVLFLNCLNQAFLLLNLAALVLSLVFYFVYLFRGEAFIWIDLFSLGTAAEVAAGYTYQLNQMILRWLIVTMNLLALWMTIRNYRISLEYKRFRILIRVLAAELCALGFLYYTDINWSAKFHVVSNLWNPEKTYQSYGTTVGSLAVAKYMRLSEPDNYSVERVEEVAEQLLQEAEKNPDMNWRMDAAGGVTPVNLICVMNESWFDYRTIGNFTTSQECMPFLDSLTDNIIKGSTLVCTKGGGTAKSEYEFLTGNSCKRFPGLVPYVCYYTHDQYSMVTTLADAGYRTVAMHPNKATNWKRSTAYRFLQFDEFISLPDFSADAQRYRNMMSDHANYQKIFEIYENKEPGEKLFLFNITMQNHSGYEHENFISNVHLKDYDSSQADEYFTLLRMSDDAIRELITYFQDVSEPTMIVMFGDHSPKLPDEFESWLAGDAVDQLSIEEQEKFYATPFFIWTNYDMEAQSDVMISTNYLSSYVFSLTGLPMTDYNRYLLDLREEIPALNHLGYLLADGSWHTWKEADERVAALENEYEILQYNNLIEKGDRIESLFTLSESWDGKN